MTKRVILCADDFGINREVSHGAMQLLDADRLSAVSCLTDAPAWPRFGGELAPFASRIYVGLHFNLTYPFGFGEKPLWSRILSSLTASIDTDAVSAALERQLERFVCVLGRLPDFIDGHQHVHAFPLIRTVIHERVTNLRRHYSVELRNVRRAFGPTDAPMKRRVIGALASAGYWPAPAYDMNTGFAGDYSLSPRADYAVLFDGWLAAAPDCGLIMCHPASAGPKTNHAQMLELRFLTSGRFDELLDRHRAKIAQKPRVH
jgi:predicted glycoside hydrolase/deacetylase ChbG (UPF0249 family)